MPRIFFGAGALYVAITGTLDASESGSDTCLIHGDSIVAGALNASESGSDTCAVVGKVVVQGALSATESGADACLIHGEGIVAGSLNAQETGADTAAFEGEVTGDVAPPSPAGRPSFFVDIVPISGAQPWLFDDRDLLEVMPIVMGLINARH